MLKEEEEKEEDSGIKQRQWQQLFFSFLLPSSFPPFLPNDVSTVPLSASSGWRWVGSVGLGKGGGGQDFLMGGRGSCQEEGGWISLSLFLCVRYLLPAITFIQLFGISTSSYICTYLVCTDRCTVEYESSKILLLKVSRKFPACAIVQHVHDEVLILQQTKTIKQIFWKRKFLRPSFSLFLGEGGKRCETALHQDAISSGILLATFSRTRLGQ